MTSEGLILTAYCLPAVIVPPRETIVPVLVCWVWLRVGLGLSSTP
jgi:hypothetical protein